MFAPTHLVHLLPYTQFIHTPTHTHTLLLLPDFKITPMTDFSCPTCKTNQDRDCISCDICNNWFHKMHKFKLL